MRVTREIVHANHEFEWEPAKAETSRRGLDRRGALNPERSTLAGLGRLMLLGSEDLVGLAWAGTRRSPRKGPRRPTPWNGSFHGWNTPDR